MKTRILLLGALMLGLSSAQQVSSPFGIPMNSDRQRIITLGGIYQEEFKTWKIVAPPVANNAFDFYTISYTEKFGICQISAIGKTINTTPYGQGLKEQFASLRTALASKYGQDKNYDFLHANSIWDEDKYWMRSLEQNERSLASFWNVGSGAKLPADMKEVVLVARALSSDRGYVNVFYRSANYDLCRSELEKASTNGL